MRTPAEQLADKLLEISAKRGEIFARDDESPYAEQDAEWIAYLTEQFDPDNGVKIEGVALGANGHLTGAIQPVWLEALKIIDAGNKGLDESQKRRLDEDLVRAIAWNKTGREFRYSLAGYDCFRAPITNTGSFRVFVHDKQPAGSGLIAGQPLPGQSARDITKHIEVLQLIRSRRGNPDGIGTLGGLTDRHPRDEPLEQTIEEKLFNGYQQLLGKIVFEHDIEGKTTQDVAEIIKGRIGQELFGAVGAVIEMAIAQILLNGKADDIIADMDGKFRRISAATEAGRAQLGQRTSGREAVEELTEALEVLRLGLDNLDMNSDLKQIRDKLSVRLEDFIGRLKLIRDKEAERAVAAADGKQIEVPADPFAEDIAQVGLQLVYDDGYYLSMWKPKTLSEAVRPPAGVPKISLIKPIGFRTRLQADIFGLIADVGTQCKEIVREVQESKNPALDSVKEKLSKKEIRGLDRSALNDSLKRWGKKGGEFVHPDTGDDLSYCFRYAHEYWAFWDEARARFEASPQRGKTTTDLMVELVEQLQDDICDYALGDPANAYTIDIITAVRLMNGGKLERLSDTFAHAEKLGLDADAFIRMHKAAEAIMAKYKFTSTSTLKDAISPPKQNITTIETVAPTPTRG